VKLLRAKDIEGRSALRLACWQGELEVVSLLTTMSVTAGLSLNEVDIEGRSSLFAATYTQTLDVVKCLLENKSDPNLTDRESRTRDKNCFNLVSSLTVLILVCYHYFLRDLRISNSKNTRFPF